MNLSQVVPVEVQDGHRKNFFMGRAVKYWNRLLSELLNLFKK